MALADLLREHSASGRHSHGGGYGPLPWADPRGGQILGAVKIVCMLRVLQTGMLVFAQPQCRKSGPMTVRATVRDGDQQFATV